MPWALLNLIFDLNVFKHILKVCCSHHTNYRVPTLGGGAQNLFSLFPANLRPKFCWGMKRTVMGYSEEEVKGMKIIDLKAGRMMSGNRLSSGGLS